MAFRYRYLSGMSRSGKETAPSPLHPKKGCADAQCAHAHVYKVTTATLPSACPSSWLFILLVLHPSRLIPVEPDYFSQVSRLQCPKTTLCPKHCGKIKMTAIHWQLHSCCHCQPKLTHLNNSKKIAWEVWKQSRYLSMGWWLRNKINVCSNKKVN